MRFASDCNPVAPRRGLTLMEVLIALFIFMVGIVGVVAAIPTGVTSAEWVIFQDASIHLAHSKFAEFRRDRVSPATDLLTSSAYMDTNHGTLNTSPGAIWRDFYDPAATYSNKDAFKYFDDINRYEWTVELAEVYQEAFATTAPAGTTPPAGTYKAPSSTGGINIGLKRVAVVVHMKGTKREFRFTQYMCAYD